MSLRAVFTIGLILGSAGSVFADEYQVTVDTSSLNGTTGSPGLQFQSRAAGYPSCRPPDPQFLGRDFRGFVA